jgi:Legume lectin domain/Chitobiase/beta-hexosaminidase C-terminal domain
MSQLQPKSMGVCRAGDATIPFLPRALKAAVLSAAILLAAGNGTAQNVTMQHNDISRSGANNNEAILTPSNVNTSTFGRLFSQSVDAQIYVQPLYVSGVAISGKGTHNVVFVATENDSIYAFDADNNGGTNALPLWKITLLDGAHGAASGATSVSQADLSTADITPVIGITGTPVIDPSSGTLYVIGKTKESGTYVQRLHAIDITTGSEKFGGPVALAASVSGNGNGSSGGTLNFDPKWENNRASLLLLNGIVYLPFAAHGDNGPWHGWILSYNATTLKQTGAWCVSPNGIGGGIWMGGAGLAADNNNPNGTSPGGRMFIATGNGTFDASKPYTNNMDYGDSIVRLELTNGAMKAADIFTPSNQADLDSRDLDVAAGGVLLLPDQSTGSHPHLLVQLGKEGHIYVVDRDNMTGFNSTDQVVEEFFLNGTTSGLWGMPAYGNNTVYVWGTSDNLKSYPVSGGLVAKSPAKTGAQSVGFPSPTPAITSNNGAAPIIWTAETDNYDSGGAAVLRAHDATNVSTTLYSSATNATRDAPGTSVKFVVPTIANGKAYLGTTNALAFYGLLNGAQQASAPVINPAGQSFSGTTTVTITDSTPSASIFYSTNGTATVNSTPYTGPITVSTTETISAIASAPGFLQSSTVSQTYTLQTQTLMPTFSVTPGAYSSTQTVIISDSSPTPTIYYAINGPASTSSTPFTGSATVTVSSSETLNAIATSPALTVSPQASAAYTIGSGTGVNFAQGFSSSAGTVTFNGSTKLDDTRLQLTDGLNYEAGTAWFNTPVNIQKFSTTFLFQLSNPLADGMTFTIQNTGLSALGPVGGGLGYGPDSVGEPAGIAKSVAVKFDLYSNSTEGPDSTGLYTNGVSPTTPAIDMTASGLNLHSGNAITGTLVYDGTKLTLTLTDGVLAKSFTTSWTVNIPQIVGANTAYVGFTGGTGGLAASQKILTWSFASTSGTPPPQAQAATPAFSVPGGTYSGTQGVALSDTTTGASIFYTTDGTTPATSVTGSTKQYAAAISVGTSQTITAIATAPNFTPSAVASAAYNITSLPAAATPVITPSTGTYTTAQTVSITDATSGATIFYALNGPASPSSTKYTGTFVISSTTTVNAIATAPNFATSATATSAIGIQTSTSSTPINFAAGFSSGGIQFNGHTKLNGTRLQLTDTSATNEASSAFWTAPVNISSFTNDFTFQLTTPTADGFTFTIQGVAPTAIGPSGGGLGYGPSVAGQAGGIAKSVAVKFDFFDNDGEGPNSTGLYTNGAAPVLPATTLGGNVNLLSGDIFHVVMAYDGTTLTMTITDMSNTAQTFTTSWPINISSTVGGSTAYVGFTGGTGTLESIQEILTWTYSTTAATGGPKTPLVYDTTTLPAASSGPVWRQFGWSGFPDGLGMILDATSVGNAITLTLNVPTPGIYDVKASMKENNARGIWQLAVNGTAVGSPQDEYQPTDAGAYVTTDVGNFNFAAAGNYSFKFTVVSKNAASGGYSMSFDNITLTPQ